MSSLPQRPSFRSLTPARIALDRSGGSLVLADVLALQSAHAMARDAVHLPLDPAGLVEWLDAREIPTLAAHSAAPSRDIYLRRPDLGRRLDADSRARLEQAAADLRDLPDLVIAIADGLSAAAIHKQACAFLDAFLPLAVASGWRMAPFVIARQARVALGDEIADALGARAVLVLIGERPGLSSPDSLGAYLTLNRPGVKTDADRNCVSNIRPEGLAFASAASKVARLLASAFQRGLTGVALKDEDEAVAPSVLEGQEPAPRSLRACPPTRVADARGGP
jgi:ethanolamine ammonia-lyase small subunit